MTNSRPYCSLCGSSGGIFYQGLKDCLYDMPGEWNFKKCPNPECGLIWLDPMPSKNDTAKMYQNYYTHQDETDNYNHWLRKAYGFIKEGYLAHKYGYHIDTIPLWKRFLSMAIYFNPARRSDLDFSVMYLPAQPGGRVLEVGCGSGKMLKVMKDLDWCVEGVDFDPVAVENAKSKGLNVRLGNLEAQEYPESHFDANIMSHLIEHVYKPLQLVKECYRILKPGGTLVIATPNSSSWGHRIYGKDWRGLETPRHLYVYTISSLSRLAESEGFQTIKKWTSIRGGSWMFIGSRSIRLKKNFITGSPQPACVHFWARCMQLVEWILLKRNPFLGEEIVLIVKK